MRKWESKVDGDEAEGHGKALLPLEVVHQAPVHIALDGDAILDAALHTGKRAADKLHPAAVV